MAKDLIQAVQNLHQKIASAKVGSGGSPEQTAFMIRASQLSLINNIRKNPNFYTKKMTGVGK
jgi:hypothetical protein